MCLRKYLVVRSYFAAIAILLLSAVAFGQAADDADKEKLLDDEVGPRHYVWQNEDVPGKFVPAGFMPDGAGLSQSTGEKDSPHSEPHCLRLYCQLSEKAWVGIYFLHEGEWEPQEAANLYPLLKAERGDRIVCRFWARSKENVSVQFKVGGVTKGKVKDSLTFPASTPWLKLGPDWKMYEIDVTNKDMRSLVGGFMWTCDRAHNKSKDVVFDLDDIYYVRLKPKAEVEK